ncbi:tRNA 2-thiouridine(34) synthase MnmA [Zongyangia hominis]|uniref:tRNA-specific 2-thiouridylase MnmA n=1 Tax=Zongyangia hominis TaxID=2763677 RepID=A0A926IBG3_9FIRM|nr:tRNA 2-thiouridine(34) synthase MnmA [Zongyangia hominis]MBC8570075.1 tRNA 2-thiouridine(34) synthase MnmA [Zongyangia hominis]
MSKKKILVALSGGVDSSACVYLLQKAGYDVSAVVLDLSAPHAQAVEAARESAQALGVELHVVRNHEGFEKNVIAPFMADYRSGRTPNPCVICNPTVKFRSLCQKADELGIREIATGHYADIEERNGRFLLKKAGCLERDQSYMLYRLGQDVLSRLVLPLSHLPKEQVRQIAGEAGLSCASKPDSQEICFIPDNDYASYVEARTGPMPAGDFISPEGNICGRHKGLLHYTVGQRKGLGIALGRPVFVKEIDPVENVVRLADAGGEFASGVLLSGLRFVPFDSLDAPLRAGVKIRSVAKEAPALLTPLDDGRLRVDFDSPQRAPAPGQSCVFYDGDMVVGGGFIDASL